MTELFLAAEGFMSQDLTHQLHEFGFQGCRTDLLPFQPSRNEGMLRNMVSMPWMKWQIIVHGGFMSHDSAGDEPLTFAEAQDSYVQSLGVLQPFLTDPWLQSTWSLETWNEPSSAHKDSVFRSPVTMAALWDYCYLMTRERLGPNIHITAPAPHNLDREVGFLYLKRFLESITQWDQNCEVGIHRYIPRKSAGPHVGWQTRAHEQNALDALMGNYGGMRYSVTETGISALQKIRRGFPLCWLPKKKVWLNQTQQGSLILSELLHWKDRANKVVLYQLNSGSDMDDYAHHFGIRDHEGNWKGYAYLFHEITKAYQGGEQ